MCTGVGFLCMRVGGKFLDVRVCVSGDGFERERGVFYTCQALEQQGGSKIRSAPGNSSLKERQDDGLR